MAIPIKVHAVNPVVHITVSAYIVAAPSGLIITYISDYEIHIEWTKGADADKTMLRGAIGRMPTSRADGYEVYYGTGEEATDWVNIGAAAPIYYKAFSQKADGFWEPVGVSGEANFMSMSYMWIGLIILSLGLSVICLTLRRSLFGTLAAFAWLLCMIFAYQQTTLNVQIYQALQLFFLLCFLAMMATAWYTWREGRTVEEVKPPYSHTQHLRDTVASYRGARRRL